MKTAANRWSAAVPAAGCPGLSLIGIVHYLSLDQVPYTFLEELMLDSELASLASTASSTLLTLLTTDIWEQAKARFIRFWSRTRPLTEKIIEKDLDNTRTALTASEGAGYDTLAKILVAQWASRIEELLAEHGEAEADVLALIADFNESLRPDERERAAQVLINVRNSGHGTTNVLGHGMQLNCHHDR
jgi:hypothetical protein